MCCSRIVPEVGPLAKCVTAEPMRCLRRMATLGAMPLRRTPASGQRVTSCDVVRGGAAAAAVVVVVVASDDFFFFTSAAAERHDNNGGGDHWQYEEEPR